MHYNKILKKGKIKIMRGKMILKVVEDE